MCFAPYFYEWERCMAYPTSQMGSTIIMERLVSYLTKAEFISSPRWRMWPLDAKKREDTLSSIVI